MMGFLHAHQASEDAGLYPLVRERAAGDPQGLDVLDRMPRDHDAVAFEVAKVEAAAAALSESGSDDAARATAAALDSLGVVLLPHLREEENEAMPIVSRLIRAREWDALEKVHNLDRSR